MTNEEYKKYAERHAPRTPSRPKLLWAFLTGGLICCLGQFLLRLGASLGLDGESAAAAEAIALVFLGALLTGLGVYDRIARRAGAGTLVPITGFANSVVAPALEFRTHDRRPRHRLRHIGQRRLRSDPLPDRIKGKTPTPMGWAFFMSQIS